MYQIKRRAGELDPGLADSESVFLTITAHTECVCDNYTRC